MSTRALYTFKDENGEYHVYKHSDGYPEWALKFIDNAREKAWPLPRFEADDFAAAFVAANKDGGGGIRLTTGKTWDKAISSDCEYHYVIRAKAGRIIVAAYSVTGADKPEQELLNEGELSIMLEWAATYEAA